MNDCRDNLCECVGMTFFITIIIYACRPERENYFPELKTGKIELQRVKEICQPEDLLSPKLEKLCKNFCVVK